MRPALGGYQAIESLYGEAVAAAVGGSVLITKKWQNADLVWPHSDLDFRIIVDEPPGDWFAFSESIAQVHREIVDRAVVHRRVLEHPPGWIYLRDELDAGLVPPGEVSTWSCGFGDRTHVRRWRTAARRRPWTAADERFYRSIIAGRAAGAYRLDADSDDNVVFERDWYGAHCVAWHFYAPIAFAAACLTRQERLSGKTEALASDLYGARYLDLARTGYRTAPAPTEFLARTTRLLPAVATGQIEGGPTAAEVVGAIGSLRCRIPRYLVYLSPPSGMVTDYLIERETKDLHGAVATLRAARSLLSPRLAKVVEAFLRLVPAPPTTRQSLRQYLANMRAEPDIVDTLFSADLAVKEAA